MSCQCQIAAIRAYRTLIESGQREDRAYEAAVRVFRHYHPDRPHVEAYQAVADWLDQRECGGDPGQQHSWETEPGR